MNKIYTLRIRNKQDKLRFDKLINYLKESRIVFVHDKIYVSNQATNTALALKDASIEVIHKSFDIDGRLLNNDKSYLKSFSEEVINQICFDAELRVDVNGLSGIAVMKLDYNIRKIMKI